MNATPLYIPAAVGQEIAYSAIPLGMSEDDYIFLLRTLELWRPRIVKAVELAKEESAP